ncbi:MAG: L-fucose:H+ symporter permease [Acidobacteriaceae bacterium]|jgi:FHS family L-fucose permease-like MFS transporter
MTGTSSRPKLGDPPQPGQHSIFPRGYLPAFLLTVSIFFIWGMSNNLTDILVQQFRKSFELNLLEAQLVQTANFLAYAVMATPAAFLMRRFGYKAGLVTGLVCFAIGLLMFWPAAVIGRYAPFLISIFIVGSGASILETAANPLVAQFGPSDTSEERLNLAQAFNPPGTITGVLVGTWFIFSGVDKTKSQVAAMKAQGTYAAYLHAEVLRVVPTYIILGVVVLTLALFISRSNFPAVLDSDEDAPAGGSLAAYGRLLRNPSLLAAVVAMFFYNGAQVSTWSNFIPYLRLYTPLSERSAGYWLTGSLVALAIGRIVSTPLMRVFHPARMIATYAVVNLLLLLVGIGHPGFAGAGAILITSFFMSIMYPTIFALGVKGLGPDTKLAGSLLVMAIVGGAIFPPLVGFVGRLTGSLAVGYSVPLAGYVVIAAYGFFVRPTAASVASSVP